MNELEKKIVSIEIDDIDFYTMSLADILHVLNLKSIDPSDAFISERYQGACLCIRRVETDEEHMTRIKPYTEKLRKKEQRELSEYKRLKAKFEGASQ